MKRKDFDWLTDELILDCRSTQLRKQRCFLMNKPCDYLRRKHVLSVKTVVMCFLFLRFGLCFDEENEGVLPGGMEFALLRNIQSTQLTPGLLLLLTFGMIWDMLKCEGCKSMPV